MAVLYVSLPGGAAAIPGGTLLEVRLQSAVSTHDSRQGDGVSAALVAPVMAGDRVALPTGTAVSGEVLHVRKVGTGLWRSRAQLKLDFHTLNAGAGGSVPLKTQVLEIDNARETVDSSGTIRGIQAADIPQNRITAAPGSGGRAGDGAGDPRLQ